MGNGASGGRFDVVATDAAVDQHADLFRADTGTGECLAAGPNGSFRHFEALIPEAAFPDAGQRFQLTPGKTQGPVKRRQTVLEVLGGDHVEGQFVTEGIDADAVKTHIFFLTDIFSPGKYP